MDYLDDLLFDEDLSEFDLQELILNLETFYSDLSESNVDE